MKKEEAIKILSNHEMIDVMWDKADEALNMAIDALEQEPCDDCISRADAINALGYDISIESDGGLDEYKSVIKEMLCKIYDVQKANIEKLPPVTPKPKTDMLDMIKTEIKEELRFCPLSEIEGLEHALDIIDKYKAESEDKE